MTNSVDIMKVTDGALYYSEYWLRKKFIVETCVLCSKNDNNVICLRLPFSR